MATTKRFELVIEVNDDEEPASRQIRRLVDGLDVLYVGPPAHRSPCHNFPEHRLVGAYADLLVVFERWAEGDDALTAAEEWIGTVDELEPNV